MKVLVFDTETTGLPPRKSKENYEDINAYYKAQPYIVQLSWVLVNIEDTTNNIDILDIGDYIIKLPENIKIPNESMEIHGITNEIMYNTGVDITYVLSKFRDTTQKCDLLVGHNIKFDYERIVVECYRNNIPMKSIFCKCKSNSNQNDDEIIKLHTDILYNSTNHVYIPRFCTLNSSIRLCNIKAISKFGGTYLKKPKLVELFEKLFGCKPINLHNSLIDVLCTLRCFVYIKFNHDIINEFDSQKDYDNFIHQLNNQYQNKCYSDIKTAFYSLIGFEP